MNSPRAGARRPVSIRRPGMAAVLVLIYMVLFAALAVGFYAQTTISAQVGFNEQRMLASRTAAESGMEWMRYQLSLVQIPPLTPDEQMMDVVYKDLSNRLEMTGNLGSHAVYINAGSTQIEVPEGEKTYIWLYADGPRFRINIKRKGRDLLVTSTGSAGEAGGARSAVELTFRPTQERGSFFNHGMASLGSVTIKTSSGTVQGSPAEYANVLALGAVSIGPGSGSAPTGIAGKLYVPEGVTPTIGAYSSVDGVTTPAVIVDEAKGHTRYLSPEELPEYPVADTSVFKKFATNKYVAGLSVYDNTYIPPSTNPTFSGPCTIRGVLYVQQPNYVKFNGLVKMHCVVATDAVGTGTLATNVLEFSGNGAAKEPVSTLPLNESQFNGIRELSGSFVVAPAFDVKISGNFGTVAGDICGDRVSIGGNSSVGITGSLFTLKAYPLSITGNANVSLTPNPNSLHTGIRHTEAFYSMPSTWREITMP